MTTNQEAYVDESTQTATVAAAQPIDSTMFPHVSQATQAWEDAVGGVKHWRIWLMLAYQDIKLRYRRSILGPFWLTLSMAITVGSMGLLYSRLFHVGLEQYLPYLASGMLSWTLISTLITEYTDGFVIADGFIKQIKLPYTIYMHRIAARNLIIFFHNLIVMVPILLFYHTYAKVDWQSLLLIPGLFMLYVNAVSFGMILSIIGARYRDVSQIIKSFVQVVFFVTPVMWSAEAIGPGYQWIININPIYAFLELVREPLMGKAPGLNSVIVVAITTVIFTAISAKMFTRYRSRIVYWL